VIVAPAACGPQTQSRTGETKDDFYARACYVRGAWSRPRYPLRVDEGAAADAATISAVFAAGCVAIKLPSIGSLLGGFLPCP